MEVDALKQQVLNQVVVTVVFITLYYVPGGRTTYWLASRCVYTDNNSYATFQLRVMDVGYTNGYDLYYSDGDVMDGRSYIHPVVSMPASLINANSGNGASTSTAWGIN